MAVWPQICGPKEAGQQQRLLAGPLVSESTLNPLECHRLLVQIFGSQPTSNQISDNGQLERLPAPLGRQLVMPMATRTRPKLARAKELLMLKWAESDESATALIGERAPSSRAGWSRCTCPAADWLQARRQRAPVTQNSANMQAATHECARLASDKSRMPEFGCRMSRKTLLKQLGLAQILKRASSHANSVERLHSLAAYEIEQMRSAADQHLRQSLDEFARADLHKMCLIADQSSADPGKHDDGDLDSAKWQQHAPSIAIRLLSGWVGGRRGQQRRPANGLSELARSSEDSGALSIDSEATFGSTSTGPISDGPHWEFPSLEALIKFRSSSQFQQIVRYSCDLFDSILRASPLLRLELFEQLCGSANSLQQLKLVACVECQKLRAALRFDWLPKCHWLAFQNEAACETGDQELGTSPLHGRLPSILDASKYLDEQVERAYLSALNGLLGRLLRDHFLEPALDGWINLVDQRLQKSAHAADTKQRFSLLVPVDLIEGHDGHLAAGDPGDAIKQTLEFVMNELASISSNLPKRLGDEGQIFVEVLPKGDDLLSRKRTKLRNILDNERGETGWISSGYSEMIAIVNQFRANAASDEFRELGLLNEQDGRQQATGESTRETQLRFTCRQVRLLEHFQMKLKCRLERYLDFGQLIRLDYSQLNEKLAKIVERERSLLIKLHADDICKLMDTLRLQLDELELNIDLESALEDYLNKRRQIKQSQQPDLEAQILLDGNMDADLELDQADLLHASQQRELVGSLAGLEAEGMKPPEASATLARLKSASNSTSREDEEEEFANALISSNNPNIAHLFAMSNPNGVPLGEMLASGQLGVGSRGLAPLIECRLLLGRFEHLDSFIDSELERFTQDVDFVRNFGLMFLTEFLPTLTNTSSLARHLETNEVELVGELANRTRDFSPMLKGSLDRLEAARQKLHQSNRLRSNVVNRVCLEFDWLMQQLSCKRLDALRGASDDFKNNIKHLDLIQETSTWAQKLECRLEFLSSQNELLEKEARVLNSCDHYEFETFDQLNRLEANRVEKHLELPPERCLEFDIRGQIVGQWAGFARVASSFWLLVEQFETQQVKWLNSDSKKLDYQKVRRLFQEDFSKRLAMLIGELESTIGRATNQVMRQKYATLLDNMMDLKSSFADFSQKLLPIFEFLTNRHLTDQHWIKLSRLISSSSGSPQVGLSELQHCTTVAQLLELSVQEFVGQLEEMSHQATIEHELSSLILAEATRMDEQARHSGCASTKMQLKSLEICSRLDEWSDEELIVASSRFIRLKVEDELQCSHPNGAARDAQIERLARQLVTCHTSIRRFLRLSGRLNLITCANIAFSEKNNELLRATPASSNLIVLRTNTLLSSTQQVRASLFLEYLRLFTRAWLETSSKMAARLARLQTHLGRAQDHLTDIEELLAHVRSLTKTDLQAASQQSELQLARLQQDSIKLELEREILSTREALALEKQRDALKVRDICTRQISERVIPAIRAATKALDCLGDGRSLRALRSYRPKPPLAIRLVIEAVCLLRNACCSSGPRDQMNTHQAASARQVARNDLEPLKTSRALSHRTTPTADYPASPQRHFDSLRGQIVEDYWPIACRTLNGLHTSRLISDLRQVSKRTMPRHTIHLIRRRYLSRPEFQVESIERISPESGLLARWLIAVDVFDRVINIVKPNYEQYLSAERNLNELLEDVTHRRQQINFIGEQLEQMNEQIAKRISCQAGLVDLIEDCSQRSQQLERTKLELEAQRDQLMDTIGQLQRRMQRLARRCLWQTARLVYLDALAPDERRPIERILRALIGQLEFN